VITKGRHHSNSGTAEDDDDLLEELADGSNSWEDGESIVSSNVTSTSQSVGNVQVERSL